jgi:hypothetical protein
VLLKSRVLEVHPVKVFLMINVTAALHWLGMIDRLRCSVPSGSSSVPTSATVPPVTATGAGPGPHGLPLGSQMFTSLGVTCRKNPVPVTVAIVEAPPGPPVGVGPEETLTPPVVAIETVFEHVGVAAFATLKLTDPLEHDAGAETVNVRV